MSRSPTIRLGQIAHTRSGDKGNHANIGVVVDDPSWYDYCVVHLTPEVVAEFFRSIAPSRVHRYLLPNLLAFNFVLERSLAGGASQSLRLDSQGKALGAALLELQLPAPLDGSPGPSTRNAPASS